MTQMSKAKTKKLKVVVKKKHILEGIPNSGDSCPIALALTDKGFNDVSVDDIVIEGYKNDVLYSTTKVPKSARHFIYKFDDSVYNEEANEYEFTVKPFEFNLVLQEVQ
jgi:hypothetical protein